MFTPSILSSVPSLSPSPSENVCRDGTGPNQSGNLLDSDFEIHYCLLQYASSVCLQRVLRGFSSEMDEKLIDLLRKCIQEYSDSVWKVKLWGQIGEELKNTGKFQLRILKLLSFHYHRSYNN